MSVHSGTIHEIYLGVYSNLLHADSCELGGGGGGGGEIGVLLCTGMLP